jgi:hypothetical protein
MKARENRSKTRKIYSRYAGTAFFGICFAVFLSIFVSAQVPEYSIRKKQVESVTMQILAIQSHQDSLLRKSKEYTDRISTAKLRLQKDSSLLLERRLQSDLRESRALADQIQKLDRKIHDLTKQSVELKQKLVSLLNEEIDRLTQEANVTVDSRKKLQKFQSVLELQKEKGIYEAQITQESNELLLTLDVTITEDDGPEDILRKIEIVEDQRDIMRGKMKKLSAQIQSVQKNISLQQNMLELLRDIGRGEADELDLDRSTRIAERQEQIADMASELEIMKAKQEMWEARSKTLTEKARNFHQEISKLLNPALKGDSDEPK